MSGRSRIERLEKQITTKRFGPVVDAPLLAAYDELLAELPRETDEDVPRGHMSVEHLRSNLIAHASVKSPPYAKDYGQKFAEAILKDNIERWTKLYDVQVEKFERHESEHGISEVITAARLAKEKLEWLKFTEAEPLTAGVHAVKQLLKLRRQLREQIRELDRRRRAAAEQTQTGVNENG